MRNSLAGKTVIVTRPEDRAGGLAAALRRRGARVVLAPLIRTRPPRSWRRLDAALRGLARFDAVVFASAAGVEAFFARARRLAVRTPPPAAAAAVGPATARALAARGWRASVVPEESRAEGLAAALRQARGRRALLPRAERGREALPRLLRAAGWRVRVAAAYRTAGDPAGRRALRRALAAGADAVCFASGSAVDSAAAALGGARLRRALRGCAAVAIGPVTAAALRGRGIPAAAVAARADGNALAAAVARALRTK
ncbi:MAG: uroporphyrinogen-III synthase [Elusimicrobia bacterium]|nr:uroporphyrinogen-III synthase [Elusimicrobiota bacterium]